MRISYGHQIKEEGDIYVTLAETAMATSVQAGIYGTYLVDYIPLCRFFPSAIESHLESTT